ncbi:hypothetical protein ACIBQ1_53525 [Nonomuraea sp. NPDC050153]|uniref:hypothetical protein n=1 Tax=Nonomuraea sp. NPDC050153 TaxID=3364359 RepID=UPI0037917B89
MSRPYVTAIVVAHDGARRLGETLRALVNQRTAWPASTTAAGTARPTCSPRRSAAAT